MITSVRATDFVADLAKRGLNDWHCVYKRKEKKRKGKIRKKEKKNVYEFFIIAFLYCVCF